MSNAYCTIAQFYTYRDRRQYDQLSNDDDSDQPNKSNLQVALDDAASELDSFLTGRYALPLPSVPEVLRRWVVIRASLRLYGRRDDRPASLEEDSRWLEEFRKDLTERRIALPNISRVAPALIASDSMTGKSRFSPGAAFFDRPPTDTAADAP